MDKNSGAAAFSVSTAGPPATIALGRKFARRLAIGDCVALIGRLGAGKTVFVRGLAQGLNVKDRRAVSSPTFVLAQEYAGDIPIFHLDLYRLADPAGEMASLGVDEMLTLGVVVIEWADRAIKALPRRRWEVRIEASGRRTRMFSFRECS